MRRFAVAAMIAAGALLAGSSGQAQDVRGRPFFGPDGLKPEHILPPVARKGCGTLFEIGGTGIGWCPGQNWVSWTLPRTSPTNGERQTDIVPPGDRPQKVAPAPAAKPEQKRTDERRAPRHRKTTFPEYADRDKKPPG